MGVQGVRRGLRQSQLAHLLPHVPGDELDRGLHFGNHALRFLDTLQTRLTEVCLLGNGTDGMELGMDITRNEFAVTTHAALQIDEVIGMANSADALRDLLALCAKALVRVARSLQRVFDLLQVCNALWRAARAALHGRVGGRREILVRLLERLFCLGDSLGDRPLFGGSWDRDCFAQFMLYMEEVRGVMRPQVVFNIGQKPWGFITGRLYHPTIETRQGRLHQGLPGVVITRLGRVFQQDINQLPPAERVV